ncbi:M48 family metallopeptidase [Leeia aquatica]|uniref:M48 family metallopeptidase n=1 Tax=Leeia aquatica TaxID=2725557 RepID=A0A847SDK4_9NEIS|nr:M48 family metallopeptidase [Leeia aquatica]NLR75389.1 M48 family metallopeptidase [Leeia aquatica]
MTTLNWFSILIITLLALSTGLQWWLTSRQIRHVQAHRPAVPADFAADISLADHQKAADYTVAKARLSRFGIVLDAAWLLAITLGGGMAQLHAVLGQWFSSPLWHAVATVISLLLLQSLLQLPLSLWRTFRLEARFGFNRMTLPLFLIDMVKGAALGAVVGIPFLAGALWLLQSMGAYWWLYVWLAWLGFNVLMLALYPTFIAPLFNRFKPLEDETLKARIHQLLQRCGFASSGVFVMDGSRRSSHGNAYFTGFGQNKRIVFFDTLLERLNPEEIESVLAHELGHFKRKHIIQRLIWMFLMALVALAAAGWTLQQAWFYQGVGLAQVDTSLGLFLFFCIAPLFTLPLAPLSSHFSRKHEFEADAFAVEHASANALVSGLVKLYRDNASTLTPDPVHSLFHDSHPPAAIRIAALHAARG